jgi:adenylylsulfate kinase/chloramphenicol 3-O phosphotransferase
MKKGKIIFLNGVTSTGKTSIAEELREQADEIYYHLSNDIFHCMIGKKFWIENSRMCVAKSIAAMYHAARGMCENGINVIIDGMLLEMPEFIQEYGKQHYDIMKSALTGIDITMIEVFCPLEECRRRNIARGDRGEFQSQEQYNEMNKNIKCDFKADTSVNTAEECAKQILDSTVVIKPAAKKRKTIQELFENYNEDYTPEKIDRGTPVVGEQSFRRN